MSQLIEKLDIKLESDSLIRDIFGTFDKNIKVIEKELNISVSLSSDKITLVGSSKMINIGENVILRLANLIEEKGSIDINDVRFCIDFFIENNNTELRDLVNTYSICKNSRGKHIKAKTWGQKRYIESMVDNEIVFAIGPAGTGKTYLAMAMAAEALRSKKISRIIITRPAVEAGENLGFLPGDLQDKVDPYLRPIYDALFDILGYESYEKYMARGLIEIAPLAYMRGRTLESAYIILDEAQNTTNEQMKMLLTRLGYGSKLIVTGDITQIDLNRGRDSGLKNIDKILKNIDGIDFIYLSKKDIVRHRMVQKIVEAYEKYEEDK